MFFGIIGWLIGTIGGFITIWDRFTSPDFDVSGILPVCVYREKTQRLNDHQGIIREIPLYEKGIYLIVHIKNGSRPVYISGIDIEGKVYIERDECITFMDRDVITRGNLGLKVKDFLAQKPFSIISWCGWPSDNSPAFKVEPNQERFLRFIVLEPWPLGAKMGYIVPTSDYIGFEKGNKKPKRIDPYPKTRNIFKERRDNKVGLRPFGLRDEFKTGLVKLSVRCGTKGKEVPASKIIEFRSVRQENWQRSSDQELFLRRDKFYSETKK